MNARRTSVTESPQKSRATVATNEKPAVEQEGIKPADDGGRPPASARTGMGSGPVPEWWSGQGGILRTLLDTLAAEKDAGVENTVVTKFMQNFLSECGATASAWQIACVAGQAAEWANIRGYCDGLKGGAK